MPRRSADRIEWVVEQSSPSCIERRSLPRDPEDEPADLVSAFKVTRRRHFMKSATPRLQGLEK
jgi:hypothetical protein